MNTAPSVAIIVLQYNHSEDTIKCLESLCALTYFNFKVVVVDNASEVRHLKNVEYWIGFKKVRYKLIANKSNLGYSGGNNIGIKYALKHNAEYVLILNNDVIVGPDFLSDVVRVALHDSRIGIVGVEAGKVFGFDYLSGAALLVKRGVFAAIGFFDERYFLYYEDVDFSIRARKAGFTLARADIDIKHAFSTTAKTLGAAQLLYYHTRNALLLNKTHASWHMRFALSLWMFFTLLKQYIKLAFGYNTEISQIIIKGFSDYRHNKFGAMQP